MSLIPLKAHLKQIKTAVLIGALFVTLASTLRSREALNHVMDQEQFTLRSALAERLWPTFALRPQAPLFPEDLCTHPRLSSPLTRVALMGDSRADREGLGASARWPELTAAMMSRQPQLLIHLGDWVKRGESLQEWREALSAALALKLPLLTLRGNHDRGPWWSTLQLDGLAQQPLAHSSKGAQKNAPLRVTRAGEALLYLIDTEGQEGAVREALEAHLKVKTKSPACFTPRYVLVLQHRPVWSRGPHGSDERGWARWLVPLIEQLGAQLLIAGHDHNYERMSASVGVGAQRRAHPQGVRYLTSGGAGTVSAPLPGLSRKVSLEQAERDAQFSERFSGQPHTLSLQLSPTALVIEAWATPREGVSERLDSLTLAPRF